MRYFHSIIPILIWLSIADAGMPGGITESKAATPEVQEIVNQVKQQLVEKTNSVYDLLEAHSYKTQVVNGINYFVKVKVSNSPSEYVHLRIYKPFAYQNEGPTLVGIQRSKSEGDDIEYFDANIREPCFIKP